MRRSVVSRQNSRRFWGAAAVGLLVASCSSSSDDAVESTITIASTKALTTVAATTVTPETSDAPAMSTTTSSPSDEPVVLPSTFPAPTTPCVPTTEGGAMFIVADCLDPLLTDPYIDIDEQRTSTDGQTGITVSYRYIHGGFTGKNALFSFYFPLASQYQGRFFQGTYPTISTEDAREGDIAFGISNGAYVVSTNNGGGVNAAEGGTGAYRVNAAAAKFSRQVAAALYGAQAPIRGYLYGASGGAYQTMGALDSTEGVWDGGVPMVPGTSNAIPSNQVSMLLGMRVLADKFPGIVDALEPGGSGDPYAGLDAEESATLKEISTLGFPLRGWWQYAGLNGGSFWAVAGGIRTVDPTYVDDFWSLPGYEGGDPASSVHADRMQFDTTVTAVGDGTVTLAHPPTGDPFGADLVITSGASAGTTLPFVTVEGTEVALGQGATPEVMEALARGDGVRLDNSWLLALQYYARHQVPPTTDLYAWNQYRDASGEPIYPQRTSLIGPLFSRASGGTPTGNFQGKMIMLASVMDVEAFPWSADWFEQQARVLLGDGYVDENYRLWFMDNADHTEPRGDGATAHIVDYVGELQQALLDLDAWVADGIAPPASTTYVVTDDTQVELTGDAESRGGVQPLVSLAVSATCAADEDDVSIDVDAGEAVSFTVTAGVPEGVGEIVKVEWDWDGTGTFPDTSDLDQPSPNIELCESHTYTEPGTFFAVVRVTSERKGDPDAPYGLVQNLARVRIVVT